MRFIPLSLGKGSHPSNHYSDQILTPMETENGCGLQYCSEAAVMLIFVSSCRAACFSHTATGSVATCMGSFLTKECSESITQIELTPI